MSAHRDRAVKAHTTENSKHTETLRLSNSTVRIEPGPAGPIAKIERPTSARPNPEYAGPLDAVTLDALREVADGRV